MVSMNQKEMKISLNEASDISKELTELLFELNSLRKEVAELKDFEIKIDNRF